MSVISFAFASHLVGNLLSLRRLTTKSSEKQISKAELHSYVPDVNAAVSTTASSYSKTPACKG